MTVGMVHISLLGKDFFNFDPKRKCLIGKRTGISYSIGMKLQVHIVKINTQKRFYDFAPSDLPKIVPPTTKQIENRKKKKKRIRKRKK